MTSSSQPHVEVLADPDDLARGVAEWLLAAALSAIGTFSVALSGGSTPQRLYENLALQPYRDKFPWERIHWFWGDERFVPHDDKESNYRMADQAFLSCLPIPDANIHSIPTAGLTPGASASAYERDLKSFYGADRFDPSRPLFDVTFLGLGLDGHTASLFPGSSALKENERWVAANKGPKSDMRITLTYPALNSSGRVGFLITGAEKREIYKRLRRGDPSLPAAQLRPIGTTWFFVDRAAAA